MVLCVYSWLVNGGGYNRVDSHTFDLVLYKRFFVVMIFETVPHTPHTPRTRISHIFSNLTNRKVLQYKEIVNLLWLWHSSLDHAVSTHKEPAAPADTTRGSRCFGVKHVVREDMFKMLVLVQ